MIEKYAINKRSKFHVGMYAKVFLKLALKSKKWDGAWGDLFYFVSALMKHPLKGSR